MQATRRGQRDLRPTMQVWEKGSQTICSQAHPACPPQSACGRASHTVGTPVHSTMPEPQLQAQVVQSLLDVNWLQVLDDHPPQSQCVPKQKLMLHPQGEKHSPGDTSSIASHVSVPVQPAVEVVQLHPSWASHAASVENVVHGEAPPPHSQGQSSLVQHWAPGMHAPEQQYPPMQGSPSATHAAPSRHQPSRTSWGQVPLAVSHVSSVQARPSTQGLPPCPQAPAPSQVSTPLQKFPSSHGVPMPAFVPGTQVWVQRSQVSTPLHTLASAQSPPTRHVQVQSASHPSPPTRLRSSHASGGLAPASTNPSPQALTLHVPAMQMWRTTGSVPHSVPSSSGFCMSHTLRLMSQNAVPLHSLPSSGHSSSPSQAYVQSSRQLSSSRGSQISPLPGSRNPSPQADSVQAPPRHMRLGSPGHTFPSGSCVPGSHVWRLVHVSAPLHISVSAQSAFSSQVKLQSGSHPSPGTSLPSSHCSPAPTSPSPHPGGISASPSAPSSGRTSRSTSARSGS
jgi:hypothetical protein